MHGPADEVVNGWQHLFIGPLYDGRQIQENGGPPPNRSCYGCHSRRPSLRKPLASSHSCGDVLIYPRLTMLTSWGMAEKTALH